MPINVRRARATDLLGILAIYNDAVATTTATYDYELRTLEDQQEWFDEHQRNNRPVFVAEDAARNILGWSSLSAFRPRPGYRFTLEDSIYVTAEARGSGIGTMLLPPVIDAARELRAHAVVAAIDADSEASLRLHTRFGFEAVGHLKEVGFKFDRWLDVIYMERLLDEPPRYH